MLELVTRESAIVRTLAPLSKRICRPRIEVVGCAQTMLEKSTARRDLALRKKVSRAPRGRGKIVESRGGAAGGNFFAVASVLRNGRNGASPTATKKPH
jgi:hypothetical protein